MSTRQPLTLRQSNDEQLLVTIVPDDPSDDLTLVTSLQVIIKSDRCVADTATGVLTLTTANPAQVLITAQSASQIVASVRVPATALAEPYDRWWRCDALAGTARRTALYGPVTVIDL